MQHSPKQVRLVFTRLLVFNQRNGSLFQHYRKNWQHWPLWGKCNTQKPIYMLYCVVYLRNFQG